MENKFKTFLKQLDSLQDWESGDFEFSPPWILRRNRWVGSSASKEFAQARWPGSFATAKTNAESTGTRCLKKNGRSEVPVAGSFWGPTPGKKV